ncbi:KR domain-containing protein [Trichoderma barbatum]
MSNFIIGWAIRALAAPNASVLLFEADDSLAASVKAKLSAVGGKVIFASTQVDSNSSNTLKVHALASRRASSTAITITESMPDRCTSRQLGTYLIQDALRAAQKKAATLLVESYASSGLQASAILNIIPAVKLAGARTASLITTTYVTDWKTQKFLSTTIQPLNVEGMFKPDKTYFMAGMAGGLGLSICQWMIRNGAKHMVITSRRPQVDRATLEEAERVGASVKVVAMDLTKSESVEKVVQEVCDTMPPIAGVCNAAMVLKDGFFVDMDVDQFNNTLAAKVIGSENLDSIFGNVPLDFFVLLGSVASVIGDVGQSNYHAANLFMTSLVHQRRARGLAASIIHIAYVTDVGYVTREERDRQLDSHFRKVRLMPTSETDVHHAFAEAIKGGKPESTSGYYDIIMGIEPLTEKIPSDQQPLWMKNPRFAHFDQHAIHEQQERGSGGSTGNRPITDLGINSLVAVEIRTWFLKELGADVPVVKILGGDTVQQLSTLATKKLLAKNMEAGAEKKSTTEKPIEAPAPVSAPAPVIPIDETGTALTPESGRSPFLTAHNALDFDSVSVLTAASKQDESISSNSSYTKGETLEVNNISERSSTTDGKVEEMRVQPEILREERMSPAQARLWFLSQHLENISAYNMAFRYKVQEPIGIARLKHALSVTTHNHECLRMCFYSRLEDGHPMQGVMASSFHGFKHTVNASDVDINEEMARLSTRKWDLEYGHTMEVSLLSRSSEEHVIIIAHHHIIMDVMGLGVVLNDLNNAYSMKLLDNSAGSYVDFSAEQLEKQTRGAFDQQLTFWESQFKTLPETLPHLPFANISNHGTELVTDTHHQY